MSFSVRNALLFLVISITNMLMISGVLYYSFSTELNKDKIEQLQKINKSFSSKIEGNIDDLFINSRFLAKTTYPEVALSYNMTRQFDEMLSNLSLNSDKKEIVLLADRKGKVIYTRNIDPGQVKTTYEMFNFEEKEKSFIDSKFIYYVAKAHSLTDSEHIGYIVGAKPIREVISYLKSRYIEESSAFFTLRPELSVKYQGESNVTEFTKESLELKYSRIQKSLFFEKFPLRNIMIVLCFLLFLIFIASYYLSYRLKLPAQKLIELVSSINNNDLNEKDNTREFLSTEPFFQVIGDSIIKASNENRALNKKLLESNRKAAIASTTQMLAHDVRKPFTMLQGFLAMLDEAKSFREVKEISYSAEKEINRAIGSVNRMIQDIMSVGSESSLQTEEINLESIIDESLGDVFHYLDETDINFSYTFSDHRMLKVDPYKIVRVFTNIISNAVEAMKFEGEIWFKCEYYNDKQTKILIGNSNSFIPEKNRQEIFESFYTCGKKKGTGLGLAICKKIVEDHGGKVSCDSRMNSVEFELILPVAATTNCEPVELAKHSKQISISNVKKESDSLNSSKEIVSSDLSIIQKLEKLPQAMKILIVDDEIVYQRTLMSKLRSNSEIFDKLQVYTAKDASEALEISQKNSIDLYIIDIDLKNKYMNGFDLTESLRRRKVDSYICIHSNRSDHETPIISESVGANSFAAKIITRNKLMELIDIALSDKASDRQLIFIDDNKIFRDTWSRLSPYAKTHVFERPEDFLEKIETGEVIIREHDVIVLDNNFDGLSSFTGISFLEYLKNKGVVAFYALSTSSLESELDIDVCFDLILDKNPKKGLEALLAALD